MQRVAFTLIEMLVVMAILVALAGMLIPVVVGAGETADNAHCQNNLTQLGKAILDWRIKVRAGGDKFPGRLMWLSDETKGGSDLVGNFDIYKCPHDDSLGTDPDMGRLPSWNASWPSASIPFESGSSYFYEVSNLDLPWGGHTNAKGDPLSWVEWKRWQRNFGNVPPNYDDNYPTKTGGKPFPASAMPIIRCFHHFEWDEVNDPTSYPEVFNVSWGCNFFKCSPKWEEDVPASP